MVAGEGVRLPFAAGRFDGVILARILYLMSDWQAVLRETCGALKREDGSFMNGATDRPERRGCSSGKRPGRCFRAPVWTALFHPGARTEAIR